MSELGPSLAVQITELLSRYQVIQFAIGVVVLYGGIVFVRNGFRQSPNTHDKSHSHDQSALEAEWRLRHQIERIDHHMEQSVHILGQIRDMIWNKCQGL